VPVEPWRFHELGRIAEETISGRVLDVGSPKLLASLLDREGRGRWTAVDLLADEIELWRTLDPGLDLQVHDARALPYADGSFDAVVCVSVIEHVPGDGDAEAMREMRRVLRPGGVLHLTTNVARAPRDVLTGAAVYGSASMAMEGGHFFERHYSAASLEERLIGPGWTELAREYVRERWPVHRTFFRLRPLSFIAGNLLPVVAARNFAAIASPAALAPDEHGVVYLQLRRDG
jgi:SAM-dependent methyltransferase